MPRTDVAEQGGAIRNHRIAGNRAAFVGAASDIWHTAYSNLIGVGEGKALRGDDIIKLAGADFNVYKIPMLIEKRDASGKGLGEYVTAQYGTTIARDPWGEYVGDGSRGGDNAKVVEPENVPVQLGLLRGGPREKYVIRQNIETATFFDELVDAGLMDYTGAAVLERGIGFFIAAKIAEGVVRTNPDGSDDAIIGYGTLYNRHDGRSCATANWSGTRVVCNNTLLQALATGINAKIMHSGKMTLKFEEAKKELAKGSEEFNVLMTKLRAMNAAKAKKDTVNRLFEATFPIVKEGEKEYSARRLKQIAAMTDLMLNGKGNGAGTVYDWFNGVTQWLDHEDDGEGEVSERTFLASNFGSRAQVREKAFAAAMRVSKTT